MGHALNGTVQDALIRLRRMRGPQRALDPGHRPRRDRDPGGGREGAARGGHRRATSSAARRSSSGSGSGGASTAAQIVEQYKRLGASCDYERERFTLDEGYVRAVYRVFVAPLREGADLPRQLHGQLGPGLALGDLGPRGRQPRGHRHAVRDRLPDRGLGRGADGGDGAPGDDARRHRGRGQPRRRALPGRWSAATAPCRWSAGGCRSSPTSTSTPSSAPGRSRSPPATTRTTSRSAAAHGLEEISVIGEDGRMTAAAGERFAGMTTAEAQRRRGRGAARARG